MAKLPQKIKPRPAQKGRIVKKRPAVQAEKTGFDQSEVDQSDQDDERGGGTVASYLRDVRGCRELLTKTEELAMSRLMAYLAIGHIRRQLLVAEEILKPKNRRAYPAAVEPARAFMAEFNPKGLKDKRLDAHLLKILYDGDVGAQIMLRFIGEDPIGKIVIDLFTESNVRLVIKLAKRYTESPGLKLPDLIQEGNLGLLKAVIRYDYRRGLRFSTFAVWWIRAAIGRAIGDKARTIRIPVHLVERASRINRASAKLSTELGREPTEDELAERMGIDTDSLRDTRRWMMLPTSLDEPSHEDSTDTVGDDTASESEEEQEDWATLIPGKYRGLLTEALSQLRPIEVDILRKRFGLDDDQEMTLKEIGAKYDLTRERIRQLQELALVKLRRHLSKSIGTAA